MLFAKVNDGVIIEVVTALPQTEMLDGVSVRVLWGQGKSVDCNRLGWFRCTEFTPDYDHYVHKETNNFDTIIVDGLPVSTMKLDLMDADEVLDRVFDEVTVLRFNIKAESLLKLQQVNPSIGSVEEISMISMMWDSIDDSAKAMKPELKLILGIYNETTLKLAEVTKFNKPEDIKRYYK